MAHILIVDDDSKIRWMLSEILKDEGFDVTSASNGVEGLNYFHKSNVDLIITDINMPEKDGFELIMEVRNENTKMPIIAMSGQDHSSSDRSHLKTAELLGAFATFEKPFILESILSTIRHFIDE